MLLDKINEVNDIKIIDPKYYDQLASEIREFLIGKISEHGGHLASNLGVVELTMALHLAFNLPKDKIVWDVGHQSYTHKILSGRKDSFDELRQFGGIAGFPKVNESRCDAFNTGHSSTSISAALGIVQARNLKNENYHVVAVIGDGALTGGMAYEALNNAAQIPKNFIIVLNDNEMSISRNVGGVSKYLNEIRSSVGYTELKKKVAGRLTRVPGAGSWLIDQILKTKNSIKQRISPGMFFEDMGIKYWGPFDGHDVAKLKKVFEEAKHVDNAVLIHVITKKGKGYLPAENNPSLFHGVSPFDRETGLPKKEKKEPDYTDVFSDTLCEAAAENPDIVAVTAAMPAGTGLSRFASLYPDRFFDVGIAEQHAVTSAAGMAAGGLIPVVAVYSSFLQRGFDQILHDVCIQKLHVIFAIDRAGLVGADGETHQGIFDIGYMRMVPGMAVLAPKNAEELREDLKFALSYNGPIAIRYPRGTAYRGLEEYHVPLEFGKGEILFQESETAILAAGSMVSTGEHIYRKLKAEGKNCTLVNMRFLKPLDTELIDRIAENHRLIITMEENVRSGGFGLEATAYIHEKYPQIRTWNVALPDAYVEHGDVTELRKKLGIDSGSILEKLREKELL